MLKGIRLEHIVYQKLLSTVMSPSAEKAFVK